MITVWNRREVTTCYSMAEQVRVRDILEAQNIPYIVRTNSRGTGWALFRGTRARTGSFGMRTDALYQYQFYVHRADADRAHAALSR